jgi:FlaA1/EpsC-like NDP-sugar epimerase
MAMDGDIPVGGAGLRPTAAALWPALPAERELGTDAQLAPAPTPAVWRPRHRRRARTLRAASLDALLLTAAGTACLAGAASAGTPETPAIVLAYGLVVLAVLAGHGGYRFRLTTSPIDAVGSVISATTIAAVLVIAAQAMGGDAAVSADEYARLWTFATVYLIAGRVATGIVSQRAGSRRLNTVIIGGGSIGRLVARRLLERPEWGLNPVGFLDKEPRPAEEGDDLPPVLGASWDLEEVARRHDVDHVIVTFSTAPHDVMLRLVRRCRALGIEVSLVPRLFEEVSSRVSVEHLGGLPLLRVDQADPRGWQFDVKYAIDRLVGMLAVLAASPVLIAVAAS